MYIVNYALRNERYARVGVLHEDSVIPLAMGTLSALLREPAERVRQLCETAEGQQHALHDVRLLPPVEGRMEVWAAGVTYKASELERIKESQAAASVYELVYNADRPELFFKSAAWRVVGHEEPIAVRSDSTVDVPEPELAVVINSEGEVVGYTVCNDVSSRSIEGDNPLYLPQAKIYLGSCAVGPWIRPAWEVADPYGLGIVLRIHRGGVVAWEGRASTMQLNRRLDDLVRYLTQAELFPDGVVLSTGTCLVPEMPFSLQSGDLVDIEIEQVGRLVNAVVRGRGEVEWLAAALGDASRRPRVLL